MRSEKVTELKKERRKKKKSGHEQTEGKDTEKEIREPKTNLVATAIRISIVINITLKLTTSFNPLCGIHCIFIICRVLCQQDIKHTFLASD